jgi:DNA repair exonuclease SbcCD nuclease subunit
MAEVITIGDLHFDKLDSLIPGASSLIARCVRRVFKYAMEHGIQTVIFKGDIGDKPKLSQDAQVALIEVIFDPKYKDLDLHFILGNHDFAEDGSYSLRWLEVLAQQLQSNIHVYSKPTEVDMDGVPFLMLPHPYTDTEKGKVNVIHFEVSGSTRDNGRAIDEGPKNKHFCLAGHLHTPHTIRNTYYSGTLYQTNFGESMPKFFHHVTVESPSDYEVKRVPFKPPWELNNVIVSSMDDLKDIRHEAHILYKLFVKDGADIDINHVMQRHANVVRHNSFKSKKDLQQQIEEAWEFDASLFDAETTVNVIDEEAVIGEQLAAKGLKPKQVLRGFEILRNLKGK